MNMGNCLRVMYNHNTERYVIDRLSCILEQAIAGKVNGVKKYQRMRSAYSIDVCRLEKLMGLVRRHYSKPRWDDLLQMLLSMLLARENVVETFCAVITNITHDFKKLNVCHVLVTYTMLIDVLSLYVNEKRCIDVLQALQKLHVFIISKSGVSVLVKTLSVIEGVSLSS